LTYIGGNIINKSEKEGATMENMSAKSIRR
jgi:hypothetical protein